MASDSSNNFRDFLLFSFVHACEHAYFVPLPLCLRVYVCMGAHACGIQRSTFDVVSNDFLPWFLRQSVSVT